MDNGSLKTKVDEWLESEDKDVDAGALMLLQLNKNRILYTNITRNPSKYKDKLIYELRKQSDILAERMKVEDFNSLTESEVKEFSEKVEKFNSEVLPKVQSDKNGKREDHDLLPENARKAYEENQELYPRIRSLHEKLKTMDDDRACDRYPFLKQMVAFDEQVRENWIIYDNAQPLDPNSVVEDTITEPVSPVASLDAKAVSAARKYLSGNKSKLQELRINNNEQGYAALLSKMQERYDMMINGGENFTEEQTLEFKELGLRVKE